MSTIAFIGLGIMGSPMAVHLAKAGHQVVGYNRSPQRTAALVEAGGTAADSPRRWRAPMSSPSWFRIHRTCRPCSPGRMVYSTTPPPAR